MANACSMGLKSGLYGDDAVAAEPRHEGRRLPMAVGNLGDQAFAARGAAALTGQLRTRARLVNEDQSLRGQAPLRQPPPESTLRHVRALLLRGVKHFF